MNNIFYIFVEGKTDKIFIENIILKNISISYSKIIVMPYSEKQDEIKKFIRSLKNNYFILCDLDSHGDKNINASIRKARKKEDFGNILNLQNIFVVIEMIEAWYLAGLNQTFTNQKKLPYEINTEILDKNKLKPNNKSLITIEIQEDIFKNYNLQLAITRNQSLNYFVNKYSLL